MRAIFIQRAAVLTLAVALAACASGGVDVAPSSSVTRGAGGGIYKVGTPYQVLNIWYYPREEPDYDETGIGSWYGAQFDGRLTANGETFDRGAISAAHPTLPMPVNVRVTNLENGRSLVVRVNDRGPFVNGRIIDLSERAAELLGYRTQGTARVRVSYLGRADLEGPGYLPRGEETPVEIATAASAVPTGRVETASLLPVEGVRSSLPPPMRELPAPAAIGNNFIAPAPDGQVIEVPVPVTTSIYVQAGAFSLFDNARRVAANLSSVGARVSQVSVGGRPLYRVRMGPFQDVRRADSVLGRVHELGHSDVKIVVD